MVVEIISWTISTKERDRAGIQLTTPQDLQSDTYLQSDTLPTALGVPVKRVSDKDRSQKFTYEHFVLGWFKKINVKNASRLNKFLCKLGACYPLIFPEINSISIENLLPSSIKLYVSGKWRKKNHQIVHVPRLLMLLSRV